jgi:hypothetical protein
LKTDLKVHGPDMGSRSALMNLAARAQDDQRHLGRTRVMANEEHVALLRQGTAIWNEWRKQNPVLTRRIEQRINSFLVRALGMV